MYAAMLMVNEKGNRIVKCVEKERLYSIKSFAIMVLWIVFLPLLNF